MAEATTVDIRDIPYTDAAGTAHARIAVPVKAMLPGRGDALETIALRGAKPLRAQGLLAAAESAPQFMAIAPGILDDGQRLKSLMANQEQRNGAVRPF